MNNYLSKLNDKQREAVETTDGPVLVLAGAGSGKTTVLVNRIAYIIEKKHVSPYNIMAITFTNKAANEMKERIAKLIGDTARDMWVSTFHSACVRILRTNIDLIGYERDFVIYDTSDTKTVIKECLKELNLDEKAYAPKAVLSAIGKAKDNMQTPEIFEAVNTNDYYLKTVSGIYKLYQKKLKNNNALDFDDIVFYAVKILMENPDVLYRYQQKFKYILVDEYQDTNNVQYMLISLLAQGSRNICVVGDDDQSIYKFRGANIQNILGFEDEFPDAVTIKLEQNYRSTKNILDAANAVIANNKGRKGKALWTDNTDGNKISLYTASNERSEGEYIAKKIEELVKDGAKYSDIAILYRTNAQSRVIEEMFLRWAVPYRVLAGMRFYDRKEIKDVIAYLRVISNPRDDVSIKRIINEPKRSIGPTTMEKASAIASEKDISLFEVLKKAYDYPALLRASSKIEEFVKLIEDLSVSAKSMKLEDFVVKMLNDTGYLPALQAEDTVENQTRIENIKEFMSVVQEFEKSGEEVTLSAFLEDLALVADIDSYDADQDAVVMMTIHSAKGLEFNYVFLAGMEDGLFPSARSTLEIEDLEEERRLCYVALTRAKKRLFLTNTESRMLYGKTNRSFPSQFLQEIPPELIDEIRDTVKKKAMYINKIVHSVGNNLYIPKKESEPLPDEINFKPGQHVMHKKFGRGIILSVQRFEKDARLEINFESAGRKQLMAVFAKLEKLD